MKTWQSFKLVFKPFLFIGGAMILGLLWFALAASFPKLGLWTFFS